MNSRMYPTASHSRHFLQNIRCLALPKTIWIWKWVAGVACNREQLLIEEIRQLMGIRHFDMPDTQNPVSDYQFNLHFNRCLLYRFLNDLLKEFCSSNDENTLIKLKMNLFLGCKATFWITQHYSATQINCKTAFQARYNEICSKYLLAWAYFLPMKISPFAIRIRVLVFCTHFMYHSERKLEPIGQQEFPQNSTWLKFSYQMELSCSCFAAKIPLHCYSHIN